MTVGPVAASRGVTPWLAPPLAPFLLFPKPNVDRSLFFNHRSGSGGGVTPGVTPAGTRDFLTFFTGTGAFSGSVAVDVTVGTTVEAITGGGVDSRFALTELGSSWRACRKPLLRKSRCCCEASRLVRISDCSSECWRWRLSNWRLNREDQSAHRFSGVEKLIVQIERSLILAFAIVLLRFPLSDDTRSSQASHVQVEPRDAKLHVDHPLELGLLRERPWLRAHDAAYTACMTSQT